MCEEWVAEVLWQRELQQRLWEESCEREPGGTVPLTFVASATAGGGVPAKAVVDTAGGLLGGKCGTSD